MLGEPRPLPKGAASAAPGAPWGLGVPRFHRLGEGGLCHGQVSAEGGGAVPELLPWGITQHLFPGDVPLLYKQSHIFFLKLYSPLIQFLIIVPYHARCVSAALRKLSLVVNLTPANSQSC